MQSTICPPSQRDVLLQEVPVPFSWYVEAPAAAAAAIAGMLIKYPIRVQRINLSIRVKGTGGLSNTVLLKKNGSTIATVSVVGDGAGSGTAALEVVTTPDCVAGDVLTLHNTSIAGAGSPAGLAIDVTAARLFGTA